MKPNISYFLLLFISTLFLGICLQAQMIDLEDQLILHLPMDGDALDHSGNDIPTIVGGPQLTEDRFGNPNRAYQFDGVDDSINLNNDIPLITSRSYTICLWVQFLGKSLSDKGSNVFFEQRDDNADRRAAQSTIMFNGEYYGQLVLFMRSDVIDEIFKAQCNLVYDSQWHHFVARVDSQMHMEMYVDGQLYCESDFGNSGNFVTSIDHVNLGSHHYSEGLHGALNGKMDDVFIYNRSLNMCEIEALYSGRLIFER